MHQTRKSLVLVIFLVACDPVEMVTLRLTPSASSSDTLIVRKDSTRVAAVAAVEHIARRFGLVAGSGNRECIEYWSIRNTPNDKQLSVCVVHPQDGDLAVRITELFVFDWTPKADSLRRALLDTLPAYGRVRAQ